MLRGEVHDPTARRMGGVAGHAGLFSTAADLTIFCRMLLSGGTVSGSRILAPLTIARMTAPATPARLMSRRGLGWDIDSSFSSNRGELLPLGSFGHTGFTGTSLWIDPSTRTFVIFLSNRLHPDGQGGVVDLRARIATVAAAAITEVPGGRREALPFTTADFGPSGAVSREPTRAVMTGIDVLRAEGFARLRGQRVGLVTNQTGRARDGVTTIDLLHEARDVQLVALFSPEHGIRGTLEGRISSSRDERTGLPIYSLYGDTRRPTEDMLAGLDTLVIDLQDIGARFYTYMTTMAYVMEEAAQRGIAVVVLDRPNPVNGVQIEGPTLDEAAMGFTGYFRMPIRHGLTLGELARLFDGENEIGGELTVVAMDGWRRDAWFDETGLPCGALSWPRGDRDDEYFGRPGDGRAVSADWGSVDRRRARRGRAQRSGSAGRSLLPRVVYAFGGPVRRGSLPGGASDRHGSALASTCACGSRDCVGAAPPTWRAVPAGRGGNVVWVARRAGSCAGR